MKATRPGYNSIPSRQKLLNQVTAKLKTEFIGLDSIIDQIADAIGPWYFCPELQVRPAVINLWGMTGVGKTSLIYRLRELLGLNSRSAYFNLARADRFWSLRHSFSELFDAINGQPFLLVLDELQHAGTKKSGEQDNKIIWQLLDTGTITVAKWMHELGELRSLLNDLKSALYSGVVVRNGRVVKGKKNYLDEVDDMGPIRFYGKSTKEDRRLRGKYFVPREFLEFLLQFTRPHIPSKAHLAQELGRMDGPETVHFLTGILDSALIPQDVDCTKMLVFVIGNLDEAYAMSNSYNPDVPADVFYDASLKITVPTVKQCLRLHFRNEQISRLGNTHIIYPAFSSTSYRKIIKLELDRLAKRFHDLHKMTLRFDESVHRMVYDEGVYPAQGCRPVISTVRELIATQLSKIVIAKASLKSKPDEARLRISLPRQGAEGPSHNGTDTSAHYLMHIELVRKGKRVQRLNSPLVVPLSKQRLTVKNDTQAITAVHEAGHAVLAATVLHVLPNTIMSRTAASMQAGSVSLKRPWEISSRKQLLADITVSFGGIAAEKLIFGDDNVTMGAEQDFRDATGIAAQMIRDYGMGTLPAATMTRNIKTMHHLHDETTDNNEQIAAILNDCMKRAEDELRKQKTLLIGVADYLSDNSSMPKETFREMLAKYAVDFDVSELIEDGELLFYRRRLKEMAANVTEREKKLPQKQVPA